MSDGGIYALGGTLIVGAVVSDLASFESLPLSLTLMSAAACLLVYRAIARSGGVPDWFLKSRSRPSTARGRIWSMSLKVDGAARGYRYSREEIAKVLAEASATRRGAPGSNYGTIMDEREKLLSAAGRDEGVRSVLESHAKEAASTSRFNRMDRAYMSGLDRAITLVQEE